jgi:SH3 domain protein
MNRFRSALALATVLAILVPAGAALAVKVYTTDTQETPLRANPTGESRSLLSIPPASAVELVNPYSYTKVRYEKSTGDVREGWVSTRFLNAQAPDSAVARELKAENEAMKERLDELDKEKAGLSQREMDLTDKLTKLNAAYEELKGGSVNYLKLKAEYDSAKSSLASAQEHIQTMVQENENLKLSQRVQWFVAGALVLVLGWFMGWATGRRQKRKKGSYYY